MTMQNCKMKLAAASFALSTVAACESPDAVAAGMFESQNERDTAELYVDLGWLQISLKFGPDTPSLECSIQITGSVLVTGYEECVNDGTYSWEPPETWSATWEYSRRRDTWTAKLPPGTPGGSRTVVLRRIGPHPSSIGRDGPLLRSGSRPEVSSLDSILEVWSTAMRYNAQEIGRRRDFTIGARFVDPGELGRCERPNISGGHPSNRWNTNRESHVDQEINPFDEQIQITWSRWRWILEGDLPVIVWFSCSQGPDSDQRVHWTETILYEEGTPRLIHSAFWGTQHAYDRKYYFSSTGEPLFVAQDSVFRRRPDLLTSRTAVGAARRAYQEALSVREAVIPGAGLGYVD
jgi:hypothetical protein